MWSTANWGGGAVSLHVAVVGDAMGADGRLNMDKEGNSSFTDEGDPIAVVELVTEFVSCCWHVAVVVIFNGSILEPLNQRLLDSKQVLSDGVSGLVIAFFFP